MMKCPQTCSVLRRCRLVNSAERGKQLLLEGESRDWNTDVNASLTYTCGRVLVLF
jgi:hypothetical protein